MALGISGGIVPCPAALALLLTAVGVGNALGGLLLVLVFSLGLAVVLIAIGVALVKAAGIAGRYIGSGDSRFARYASVASAFLVTGLGLVMTARAIVDVAGISVFS